MRYTLLFLLCGIFSAASAQQTSFIIYFDFDKAVPTETSQIKLTALIKEWQAGPVASVAVKGYTDKKGTNGYNDRLSQQRAAAVAAQLTEALPKTVSITTEAFGKTDLLTEEEARQDKNRRVLVTFSLASPKAAVMQLTGFSEEAEGQTFTANVSDTFFIKGKEGTFIKIPPGSLQKQNGEAVNGKVEIRLWEYYDPATILLAGLHSLSNEGLLQTGGMFRLVMLQAGDTLSAVTKKSVEIRMPVRNNALTGMNVFTQNHQQDSGQRAQWRNTSQAFSQTVGYWDWPQTMRLQNVWPGEYINFDKFRVGRSYHNEYALSRPLFPTFRHVVPLAKKILVDIQKPDSLTLRVHAVIRYRRKGYKALGIRNLDTTFSVSYRVPQYVATLSNLSLINCDRFLQRRNLTEYYVSTEGYSGMNVVVYFKSQSAYMPAHGRDGEYYVSNIPEGEPVEVVAFGRKDDVYFFARQAGVVTKSGRLTVAPSKMSREDFDKKMAQL